MRWPGCRLSVVMRSGAARLVRRVAGWQLDTIVAVGLAAGALVYEVASGRADSADWTVGVCIVVSAGSVAARRRWPFAAAVAFSAGLALVWALGPSGAINGAPVLFSWVPLVLAYGLGTQCGVWTGLAGVVLLAAAAQTTSGTFNPLFEMVTFGPWLAGRAVRSRRDLAARIEERNNQLGASGCGLPRRACATTRPDRARAA